MFDIILAHLRQTVPFGKHVGIELVSVGDGEGVAQLDEAPHRLNHVATHHAGALFTLAEAASGAAMAGAFAPVLATVRPVAATAKIDFLKPAHGLIKAVARINGESAALLTTLEQDGKVRFGVGVKLSDAQDQVIATTEVDWHVGKPRPKA